MTATAEQPPIGRGGGRRRSDRCRGDDRRRDAYDDYAYRGAGKDDAPLDDGRRKRIRRMGNDVVFFFAKYCRHTTRFESAHG
jgi:hypothetical protein